MVTSDGGAHWQLVNLEEPPVSLFFLNESLGLDGHDEGPVADHRSGQELAQAAEGARADLPRLLHSTRRTASPPERRRRCSKRTMAAQTWTPVAAAAEPPGNPDYSGYSWIAFATPKIGIITGWNHAAAAGSAPAGLAGSRGRPQPARRAAPFVLARDARRRRRPGSPTSASLFGQVTRVRLGAAGARHRA